MKRKKSRIKIKWKNLIILLMLILCSIAVAISLYNIINWYIDGKKEKKISNNLNSEIKIVEIKDNSKTEIIKEEKNKDKSNPYWDYIKMNLIDVDFKNLLKINKDVKGWITINGTNVNYPFVQGKDNEYYLSHSLDKSINVGGWLFMDYRNNPKDYDKNTIIYGHGMTNKTMFGSLKQIINNGWLNSPENFIIKISTENENTLWQIFSLYKIPNTSDYLQTYFNSDEEFNIFIDKIKNRSIKDFKTDVSPSNIIITLSTCYDNYNKIVLHAKLIKKETR